MSADDLKRFELLAACNAADREAVFELLEDRKASRGVALLLIL